MSLRTASGFLEALRDGREIWLDGERVKDVTPLPHPAVTSSALHSCLVGTAGTMLASWRYPMRWVVLVQDRPWEWGWGMHPMMWGAWGIGMAFIMFLFWALVIIGVVLAIRWLVTQSREPRGDRALEILRERYARGEISKEEFETRRRDLEAR